MDKQRIKQELLAIEKELYKLNDVKCALDLRFKRLQYLFEEEGDPNDPSDE